MSELNDCKIESFEVTAKRSNQTTSDDKGIIDVAWETDISENYKITKQEIIINPHQRNIPSRFASDTEILNKSLELDLHYTDSSGNKHQLMHTFTLFVTVENKQDASDKFDLYESISNVAAYNVSYVPNVTVERASDRIKITVNDEMTIPEGMDSDSTVDKMLIYIQIKDPSGNNGGYKSVFHEISKYKIKAGLNNISPEDRHPDEWVVLLIPEDDDLERLKEHEVTVAYSISTTPGEVSYQGISEFTDPVFVVPSFTPEEPRGLSFMRPDGSSPNALRDDTAIQLFWQSPVNDLEDDGSQGHSSRFRGRGLRSNRRVDGRGRGQADGRRGRGS